MAKQKKNARKKGRKLGMFFYIIGFVLMVVVLSFAAVLFFIGMLPSFVASYVDNSEERNNFRVVAACNFSGVLPFIMQLFRRGEINSDAVYDLLFTPTVWLVMYGSAAFGWVLVWLFPQMVHAILNMMQDTSIKNLQEKQQSIVNEWGLEVETTSRRALRNAAFADEHRRPRNDDEPQMPRLSGPG